MASAGSTGDVDDPTRRVALHNFDPSTIQWPYPDQKPLALVSGDLVVIDVDDGNDWVLGHLEGRADVRGYFPKNYTMSAAKYRQMMEDYKNEVGSGGGGAPSDEPSPTAVPVESPAASPSPGAQRGADKARPPSQELAIVDPAQKPPKSPQQKAPQPSSSSASMGATMGASAPMGFAGDGASRMRRNMPPVPMGGADDDLQDDFDAMQEEREDELAAVDDPYGTHGGGRAASRCSTPSTKNATRPAREAVRRHLPMNMQTRYLKALAPLDSLVRKTIKLPWKDRPAYAVDMRVRATTVRSAALMRPCDLNQAMRMAAQNGARMPAPFRPGFNDLVNETSRMGSQAAILSDLYNYDDISREHFQKSYLKDVNGTLWFELQRKLDSVFYTRMDFVDVMMYHPSAWGFPDIKRSVTANPGEPIDPFHGWYAQQSVNVEQEIADVDFLYTLRMRTFPEKTFQALALGKIPEWVDPYATQAPDDEAQAAAKAETKLETPIKAPTTKHKIEVEQFHISAAGLEDGDEIIVKMGPDGQAEGRVLAPDVLETKITPVRIKGLSAMRIFLRSRGNPDNMKQTMMTPKMVKDMAAQLGIRSMPQHYWYCLFAMRYPLSPEWEVVVRDDTRFYLHLPTDTLQPIHPMVKAFREHLDDCVQNEFLWEFREPPVVQMKCSECGMPDSIVWCMQCTDYFCAPCFFQSHRSKRGKKHWPMPLPGTRYLSASESTRLRDHLPLLNVGFSMRRRFLARDNQSDKNGSRNGDTWLFFHADTFQCALQQAPEKNWFLKRLKPPRLAPGTTGYYYNFATDILADDASHILTKAHEQKALFILQKNMKGAIIRRKLKREVKAVIKIQGAKKMWDVKKLQGSNGANGGILKKWYSKHKAQQDQIKLEYSMSRLQAIFCGFEARRDFFEMLTNVKRFQSNFRSLLCRRRHAVLRSAVSLIQRQYRGRLYGRKPMQEQNKSASLIQALARGVAHRERERFRAKTAVHIQAHVRGLLSRLLVKNMYRSGIKIQANWKRFQAQLDVKLLLYDRLEMLRRKTLDLIRRKLEESAALLIQRNFKRYRDFQRCVYVKREKGEADKKTSTMIVAVWTAASNLRHFVHPFFRHLPEDIQEVLMQIKASMQRTIGLVPVQGKLASEELGRRALKSTGAAGLHYNCGEDIELATHMLLSVSRHLLSHLPAEQFAPTVKWACYAIGHQACSLDRTVGCFPREILPIGKEPGLPPHPGDSLNTLYEDVGTIRHHHDWLLSSPDESFPALILHGLPSHHRHVFLTAQVLVTMRQALDSPAISTDDHLKFQGLDAAAGAQLMEVMGSELDHRLPLDWPKVHGSVAALANQMSQHMLELSVEAKKVEAPPKEAAQKMVEKAFKAPAKAKAKPGGKAKAKTKASAKAAAAAEKAASVASADDKASEKITEEQEPEKAVAESKLPELPEGGTLSHFNRHASLRIVQQMGFFMCDQDKALQAVLSAGAGEEGANAGGGSRQSRYVSVTDKLFEMADRASHDHCSFLLAVVLYHMVMRSLMLRVLLHRAAIAIQARFRYLRAKGMAAKQVGPAIRIQRHWRGLRDSLKLMRQDDAAAKIQISYQAWKWNSRSRALVKASLRMQRIWHSAVHRFWLRKCHAAARTLQRFTRGMEVRFSLDKVGRELVASHQTELKAIMARKSQMPESLYIASTAALTAKARVALHKHRQRNIDLHKMQSSAGKNAVTRQADKQRRLTMKGVIQPARESVFEPMIFALKRLEPNRARLPIESRVLQQVDDAKRKLNRYLPPRSQRVSPAHACARRGHAAVSAKRAVKRAPAARKGLGSSQPIEAAQFIDDEQFELWHASNFMVVQEVEDY